MKRKKVIGWKLGLLGGRGSPNQKYNKNRDRKMGQKKGLLEGSGPHPKKERSKSKLREKKRQGRKIKN